MKLYDRNEERTGLQEQRDYNERYDIQCDFVMVYGFHDLKNRIAHWKKRGYVIHLMTGVSWGEYQDYLYGKFDGIDHHDEGQLRRDGSDISHGKDVPYMVPSVSFSHYLAENLKKAVDYGVEAIHLEEPEFWVASGYSEAFKREWRLYYKEEWQDPQATAEGQYMASRLKQYLYKRTLDRLCAELKEYALKKYNRVLRFYVPTHSLINYSQWRIVSPESALIDLPVIDGYIAQIWTGTAREPNTYHGVTKERTFETAFLEYGVMQELVRGTGRKMWFLHDPIEDNPRHTWQDYRENYYRTVVASLFHPDVSSFEVSPWPARIFMGKYPKSDGSGREPMPEAYTTNLLTVMHALRDMETDDHGFVTDTAEIGILLADSGMYQRLYPENTSGCEENSTIAWNPFYGLALPLLKSGICVRPVQLDNLRRFAGYLDCHKSLVLSYEFMKPDSPDLNVGLANWVREGGKLFYVGDGSDAFHTVRQFWNRNGATYHNPAEHLFESMGLSRDLAEGTYPVGKGSFTYIAKHPTALAKDGALAEAYVDTVTAEVGGVTRSAAMVMRRGKYVVSALFDETEREKNYTVKGLYMDMFSHTLDIVKDPVLREGDVKLFYDLERIDKSESADVLAVSGRVVAFNAAQRSLTFIVKGPSEMTSAARIYTKRPPKSITVTIGGVNTTADFAYDEATKTTYLTFPSTPTGTKIKVSF